MTERSPVVSVLIVNYNSTPVLRECLHSVEQSTVADQVETIVVDNASGDFDVAAMRQAHPSVTFLPQSSNTTYTGGNNIAFAHASADLVLMLNPDTRLEPDTLERAVDHMHARPDVAGLSAYLIGPDGKLQRYYRRLPSFADLPVMLFEPIFRHTRRGRRFLMLDEAFDRPTPVQDPPGAFILVRRSALGGRLLDDGYFNFVSDLELCDRLNRMGGLVVFPDVRCHHQRGGAGVGNADINARLRLYHDYTWGLRRYFRARLNFAALTALQIMLGLYWLSRVAHVSKQNHRALPRAVATASRALAAQAPSY